MSGHMTPVGNPGQWAPPYDGPGYANERSYLSKIPFRPQRDRYDDIRRIMDQPFRPARDRRMRSITPQNLRGTLDEMSRLKAAGKIGLLARRFGLGWPQLLQALLAELGIDPFDDPWARRSSWDYQLAANGFQLCCQTSNKTEKFALANIVQTTAIPPCSSLPTLWCGTTLQPTWGNDGDPITFPGFTGGPSGTRRSYDTIFFGPSLVNGTRLRYEQRYSRVRGPFGTGTHPPSTITPRRPVYRIPDDAPMPTRVPFEQPRTQGDPWEQPDPEGQSFPQGRPGYAPYEIPAAGFEVPPRGPPIDHDGPHQLLPPGKAPEKKRDFNTGLPGKVYGGLTEAADFLECAEKALPKGIPRVANRLHERMQRVFDNWEKIDVAEMTLCIQTNAANDAVVGKYNALANRGLAFARRNGYLGRGRARGIGFGSWSQRMR